MQLVHFALGAYGFSGAIMLVIFIIYPKFIEARYKKRKKDISFFSGEKPDEDRELYTFYSRLWSFRLISTGFLIRLIYAFQSSDIPLHFNTHFFIIIDIAILSFAALSIVSVRKGFITLRYPYVAMFYIGPSPTSYFPVPLLIFALYFFWIIFHITFEIDILFIIASFLSAFLFSVFWQIGRNYYSTNTNEQTN